MKRTALKTMRVAIDIGGVLVADPWQAIILTPGVGLADRLGIPSEAARQAAEEIWPKYATQPADEGDYWRDFSNLVHQKVDIREVREAESNVWVISDAARLFIRLSELDVELSIVSDNTPFWFDLQLRLCPSLAQVHAGRRFLSFERGVRKSSEPYSLYMFLAYHADPARTLVVDDRAAHIARAKELGFKTKLFQGSPRAQITREIVDSMS